MTLPKFAASLTFVPPEPESVRLKMLKASPRISIRIATLAKRTEQLGDERVFVQVRKFAKLRIVASGVSESANRFWLGNFEMSWNRSHVSGSKSSTRPIAAAVPHRR